jgi:two-component system chemotaxis response regulator CheB
MQPATEAIVVGGSAGALDSLFAILGALPARFPLPVAIVLHIPASRPSQLAAVLRARCALSVKEAEDKEPLAPSTVYVAPPDYHLLIEKRGCFSLSVDEPVNYSRPAIDVLFESAADAYGAALVGVILTGANADGARGLLQVQRKGGLALVQAPDTALARTMPEAALRLVATEHVFSPQEIGRYLARLGDGLSIQKEVQ